jgi:acetyltransferase-like isoleucine patch superfamily enzyme
MKLSIMEKLTIEDHVIVGLVIVVCRNVPAGATVVGNPAKVIRGKEERLPSVNKFL